MSKIITNQNIGDNVFLLEAKLDYETEPPYPGEFYMIRAWNFDPLLNRPLSVYDFDYDRNIIRFLYGVIGKGTNLLCRMGPGSDLVLNGPYGNPFLGDDHDLCLVGGGLGIAPLYFTATYMREYYPKRKIRAYLGYTRTAFALNDFYKVCNEVNVQVGGKITDLIQVKPNETVLSCGPYPMMDKVNQIVPQRNNVYMSLESRMACGLGACLGCATNAPLIYRRVNDNYNELYATKQVKICSEGPVFEREFISE